MSSTLRIRVSVVVAAAIAGSQLAHGQPYSFIVTGACDDNEHLDGKFFVKMGNTLGGSPWYKATGAEQYVYYDPDCGGSGDGTARWVFDKDRPNMTRATDLDGDGQCEYYARFDSVVKSEPPESGTWTMNCDNKWVEKFLVFMETTSTTATSTTVTAGTTGVTTTLAATTAPKGAVAPKLLALSGACDYKNNLNGLTFELQGTTAEGEPYYKSHGMNYYIYHDADCDGSGSAPRWVLDGDRPSALAAFDLDGDHKCDYFARLDDAKSPAGPATWRMYCGSQLGWSDVKLTLSEVSKTSTSAKTGDSMMVLSSAVGHGSVWVAIAATIFVGAM
mmetsp:Transcript_86295/g.219801  ORF Transcript_86295/g.219801 Transcript_86295/m.219801 type:complete len:332 (+) Transcript_86295:54-1049(+)